MLLTALEERVYSKDIKQIDNNGMYTKQNSFLDFELLNLAV